MAAEPETYDTFKLTIELDRQTLVSELWPAPFERALARLSWQLNELLFGEWQLATASVAPAFVCSITPGPVVANE